MEPFGITRDGASVRVALQGKLTAVEVPGLQLALKREMAAGVQELVFDFGDAGVLDSTGIGLLIASHNSLAAASGAVRLVNVSPEIMKLLQTMRLTGRLRATADEGGGSRG